MTGRTSDPAGGRRPPFTPAPTDPAATTGSPAELPPERWEAIVHDLATRGVTGRPVLVSAAAVTWVSGALGCPEPGRSYTQSLVEGMRAIVEVDGRAYDYRFGRGDTPRLCDH